MKTIFSKLTDARKALRDRAVARECGNGGDTVEYAFVAVVAILCGIAVLAFGNTVVSGIQSAAAQAAEIFGSLSA